MDFSKKENDIKITRKLSSTPDKIRINHIKLRKGKKEFQEIKNLLSLSDANSFFVDEKDITLEETISSLTSCNIPINAPGSEIFHEDKIFSYFNEKSLCLKDFLNANKGCSLGKDAEVPNEGLFRTLIASHLAETFLPNDEKCHLMRLYVLYLLSVHTDKGFVSACVDFLKYRRFKISGFEILPIYVNFGCTLESLIGSNDVFDLPVKFKGQTEKRKGENLFPYYNAEMVANIILYYANFDLIKKDRELKVLLKALTRLTLDRKIRSSRLLSSHSLLTSVLSSQLARVYDLDDIASCLHLKNEHILNQLEVVRIVHMPVSSELYKSLFIKTITFLLNEDISAAGDTVRAKYVWSVLKKLTEKDLPPLNVYCILQLINGSLPNVTATDIEASDINNLLVCLEAGFRKVEDSIDLIRLKLEVAKLRSLVMNSVGKIFPVDYLNDITLSTVKESSSCSI